MSPFLSAHQYRDIKTVANLSNNNDVFMCILCFHARAGYLQTYETLQKEVNLHPGSASVEDDQYQVGICGRDGRATASVRGDGGSIPTCGALEVWPCDFGPKHFGWLINQLGEP